MKYIYLHNAKVFHLTQKTKEGAIDALESVDSSLVKVGFTSLCGRIEKSDFKRKRNFSNRKPKGMGMCIECSRKKSKMPKNFIQKVFGV